MIPLSDGIPARRFPVVNVALIAAPARGTADVPVSFRPPNVPNSNPDQRKVGGSLHLEVLIVAPAQDGVAHAYAAAAAASRHLRAVAS
jgi:hypothetical protein